MAPLSVTSLQAGFNVVVGEIIARKVDELVAHVIGHRVIDRDGADVRQVMGLRSYLMQEVVVVALRWERSRYSLPGKMLWTLVDKGLKMYGAIGGAASSAVDSLVAGAAA